MTKVCFHEIIRLSQCHSFIVMYLAFVKAPGGLLWQYPVLCKVLPCQAPLAGACVSWCLLPFSKHNRDYFRRPPGRWYCKTQEIVRLQTVDKPAQSVNIRCVDTPVNGRQVSPIHPGELHLVAFLACGVCACHERISDQSTCMLPARRSGIFLRLSLIVAPSLSLNGTLGIGFP